MTTPSAMPGAARPYPPTPPGPYPQIPYGQPSQHPKKRRTWLLVLLAIFAVMLIGVVSCGALIGTAGKAVTEVSASQQASQQAEEDRNAPREVTPGKAFTIGSHKVLEGWKVEVDSTFGDAEFQVTGKAKNVSDATPRCSSTSSSSTSLAKCWATGIAAPETWSQDRLSR
jgi:hypothetical protein